MCSQVAVVWSILQAAAVLFYLLSKVHLFGAGCPMLPMDCPVCSHSRHRAVVTNSKMHDQVVRKRACESCGHIWYTVEVTVPSYAVGWIAKPASKPVLRVPIDVTVGHTQMRTSHEEASDQLAGLREVSARRSAEADERHRLRQPPLHDAPPAV